ncbi:MAG: aminotransferase class V-fold PLP-dependent enzyme [Ignavibacteriales bacterium]|nr:aminotransferase class V-fold PLP-dependent enzyme [Ignavibacteriales bacterium]
MTYAANTQRALEQEFDRFRRNIVGCDQTFRTPYGEKRLVYADWTASGRLYGPIERALVERFGPFVGNTHSESSVTGSSMTRAYQHAHEIIKNHVHAATDDVLLHVGFGMTAAVNKLQRILGLKIPERFEKAVKLKENDRPVVFVSHMEHHSNHTTWYETIADVVVIKPTRDGLVDLEDLDHLLQKYKTRKFKIGAFTACSNVTGVETPYREMARMMHEHDGICFIDFAASAPYVPINIHPDNPLEQLDAIVFSPHKFLGGPGTSGVLIFNSRLYHLKSPDQPGGGTVLWTNPWGRYRYKPEIEEREDGGTPGFLQAIKAGLAVRLKEEMGLETMRGREDEIVERILRGLEAIPGLVILAPNLRRRLGMISFYFEKIHYNLVVRLLNDHFGIQSRGGCSCAGTYGHYLLHVDKYKSKRITDRIDHGDLSMKPGWVRISVHPTTTDGEIDFIVSALKEIGSRAGEWEKDYRYDSHRNEFFHRLDMSPEKNSVENWFRF